eukprot:366535-Chlamydomonas_euryale.AAC.1
MSRLGGRGRTMWRASRCAPVSPLLGPAAGSRRAPRAPKVWPPRRQPLPLASAPEPQSGRAGEPPAGVGAHASWCVWTRAGVGMGERA